MPPNLNNRFWADEIARLQETMDPIILAAFLAGIDSGIVALPAAAAGLVNVDLINQAAIEFARNYSFDLVSGITDTTRRQLSVAIQNWIREGQPLDALIRRIEPIFGPARADMIAATEITRSYASGNMIAWTTNGLVGAKRWMTAVDERVCPICGALHNTIVQIDQPWRFTPEMIQANPQLERALRSAANSFFMPPAHPRCRCWLQPVVLEAYDPAELANQFFGAVAHAH